MPAASVRLSDPVVAALSTPDEKRWGVHQFPTLGRLPDESILLTYSDAEDASESHGFPCPAHVSCDEGRTWTKHRGSPVALRPHFALSSVYRGEHLTMAAQPHLDCAAEGIEFPEPVATAEVYSKAHSYRCSDFPQAVRDYFGCIPAKRWKPDGRGWREDLICARRRAVGLPALCAAPTRNRSQWP